jgi:hypothetical protein
MTLYCDIFENPEIARLLGQSIPTKIESLNSKGLPDFFWIRMEDQHARSLSHKQVGEILSGLDSVEEQLTRDYVEIGAESAQGSLDLAIEGIIIPDDNPDFCWTLEVVNGNVIRQGKKSEQPRNVRAGNQWVRVYDTPYRFSYAGYRKKLARFSEAGIQVHEVPDRRSLVTLIQALYECDQEPGTTFNRVIRAKKPMPRASGHVLTLMSAYDPETGRPAGVGQEIAQPLIERYGSVWELLAADMNEASDTLMKSGRRVGNAAILRIHQAYGTCKEAAPVVKPKSKVASKGGA